MHEKLNSRTTINTQEQKSAELKPMHSLVASTMTQKNGWQGKENERNNNNNNKGSPALLQTSKQATMNLTAKLNWPQSCQEGERNTRHVGWQLSRMSPRGNALLDCLLIHVEPTLFTLTWVPNSHASGA